jgi:Zn-dependent protease
MNKGFLVTSIFGIDVRVNLSWLTLSAFLLWSLGGYAFPAQYPNLSSLDAWTLALAVTVFLGVSLAAHELGHGLVSNRLGLPVKSISLFFFGGLTQMSQEPRRPRDEFLIALAGPAVSLVLAAGSGVLALAGPTALGSKVAAFGTWLAWANLWLTAFNLLPGLPLDGGRALRAALWALSGSYRLASRLAGLFGRLIGYGLLGLGIALLLAGDVSSGLWLMLLAWLLEGAARQSTQVALLKDGLAGYSVRQVMLTDCPRVGPALTLDRLVREVALPSGRKCFPVAGGSRVTGLITWRDIMTVGRKAWQRTTVGMAMKPIGELLSVAPDERAYEALQVMARSNLDHVAVVEAGQWVGVVTLEHLLQWAARRPGGEGQPRPDGHIA